jgi:hypothetical protein
LDPDPDSLEMLDPDPDSSRTRFNVAFFRLKDLRSPAKKWKLEKNAQQLYMTGTVVLYQVFCRAGSGLGPDPDALRPQSWRAKISFRKDYTKILRSARLDRPESGTITLERSKVLVR